MGRHTMNIHMGQTGRLLLSLYIPSLVISFGQGMTIPTIPVLATEFNVSIGMAAQVVTAQLLGRVLCLAPSGWMVDTIGRRPLLIGGPLVIAAGAAATALAPTFWILLVAQLGIGFGNNMWMMGREIAAIDLVRQDQRGRLMSGFMGMSSVGMSMGPALGGFLTETIGFRAVFWGYVIIALGTMLVSMRIPETRGLQSDVRPDRTGLMLDFGSIKQIEPHFRGTFVVLIYNSFVAFMRSSLLSSMIPLYVGVQLGYSPIEIGTLFTVMGVVNFLMIVPTGVISDKYGRKAVVVPSGLFATVAFLGFPLSSHMALLALGVALMGVSNGLGLGTMATYTYDIIPVHARGRLQAIRRTLGETGGVIGPIFAGVIADVINPGAAFFFFLPLQATATYFVAFKARESLERSAKK